MMTADLLWIIGLVFGLLVLIGAMLCGCFLYRRKKRKEEEEKQRKEKERRAREEGWSSGEDFDDDDDDDSDGQDDGKLNTGRSKRNERGGLPPDVSTLVESLLFSVPKYGVRECPCQLTASLA